MTNPITILLAIIGMLLTAIGGQFLADGDQFIGSVFLIDAIGAYVWALRTAREEN